LRVTEIFHSLQGEGPDSGVPAVFIRLTGCNVRCSFCDTKYAFEEGVSFTLDELVSKVKSLTKDSNTSLIVITGGEPLLQQDKIIQLICELSSDFHFAIETNGTLSKPTWWKKVIWDVDCKCPSSEVSRFDDSWKTVGEKNRIKFVVSDERDLPFVVSVLPTLKGPLCPTILVSPAICGDVVPSNVLTLVAAQAQQKWLQRVWEFCVQNDLRFSLQNHKVVFGNRKGV